MAKFHRTEPENGWPLDFSKTDWDTMGINGLRGKEVGIARYHQGEGPTNPRAKFWTDGKDRYKTPKTVKTANKRKMVIEYYNHRKPRAIKSGVIFSGDAYENPEENPIGQHSPRTLSSRFRKNKLNEHGTETVRNRPGKAKANRKNRRKVQVFKVR